MILGKFSLVPGISNINVSQLGMLCKEHSLFI